MPDTLSNLSSSVKSVDADKRTDHRERAGARNACAQAAKVAKCAIFKIISKSNHNLRRTSNLSAVRNLAALKAALSKPSRRSLWGLFDAAKSRWIKAPFPPTCKEKGLWCRTELFRLFRFAFLANNAF
eukprot:scaffold1452_cov236-Pinguiococcus_pyrenoidosus.AAC.5